MTIWQALILSLVEGVTEFLPVSSTGHMILASQWLGVTQTEFLKSFEIMIQLGAILAVVGMYFVRLWNDWESVKKILVGFLPTGIAGALLYSFIKTYLLGNSAIVVGALFLGGVVMIVVERNRKETGKPARNASHSYAGGEKSQLTYTRALAVGSYQILSMIPGVSRSMATILGGMKVGLSRVAATEFSFMLAIPTMAAATGMDILKMGWQYTDYEIMLLGVGMLGAFLSALLTVRWLLGFVRHHSFVGFGVYRIGLAILFGLWLWR